MRRERTLEKIWADKKANRQEGEDKGHCEKDGMINRQRKK